MLQAIRDKTSGWIAYLIIGLISIPFALWGINSYLGGGEEKPVAIVDGDEITPRQLDYAYTRYRERLASVFGGRIPEAFNDENTLKEQALSQIIEERVLLKYINDNGYRVGNTNLLANIQAMQVFQQDGKFSNELYQNQLASQGYSPAMFEQELRRSQEMEQLNLAIKTSAFTVPVEVKHFNTLKNQQRKLRTLTFKNQTDLVEVSDQQITDYYNEQSAQFMEPSMVKLDYIELNLDTIKKGIQITEDKLLERYDQLRDQLTTEELRTASHILLTVGENDDEAAVKLKIDELKQRITQGEDFSTLAREFSQDKGSAQDGGDLGDVERGAMVKPFETALFALHINQVSEPVKTQFGWHIIKLNGLSGGDTQSFEQARTDIEEELKANQAESQIYDLAENLASIGYEEPDSLLPVSEQLDLKIQTTDWFTSAKGEGLAEQEKIRQIAFSDDVLNQNRNSETIELSDSSIVIVHLNQHKPSEKKSMDSVREDIIETLKRKAGRELAQAEGKKILTELQAHNNTLDGVAGSLSVVDLGFVDRSNAAVERDVLSTAFAMAKPTVETTVFEAVAEANGDYTIIELSEVRVNTDESADKAKDDPAKTLTSATANHEYRALIKSLTKQADIMRFAVKDLQ
ncbi:MAG: hypothetical protein GY744_19895 [Gammaproteobacteria bacterium]|nr:hypothetical protein [Gammaproteobacteria bacterium]